jgi:hypothetical protein
MLLAEQQSRPLSNAESRGGIFRSRTLGLRFDDPNPLGAALKALYQSASRIVGASRYFALNLHRPE